MAQKNGSTPFKKGEPVVHPDQGAGIIKSIITMTLNGEKRRYFQIDLIDGKGTLLVPIEQAKEIGLRNAFDGLQSINDVLINEPAELDGNHKVRQSHVSDQLSSGDPQEVARALRDLEWRERVDKLTMRDMKLKEQARQLLAGELAAAEGTTMDAASQRIITLLTGAMEEHEEEIAVEACARTIPTRNVKARLMPGFFLARPGTHLLG